MPDYRNKLTLDIIGGQRVTILHCNKSEQKSFVRHHALDGGSSWAREAVASRHDGGKPKHLHIFIPDEGVYEIFGQPHLKGSYVMYRGKAGTLYYAPVSPEERKIILNRVAAGSSYRQALAAMGKNLF